MHKPISIGILGASGLLGETLPVHIHCIGNVSFHLFQHRSPLDHFPSTCIVHTDLSIFLRSIDSLISFIPIWSFINLLESCKSLDLTFNRIVAVSSTSALTKINSTNAWEREYATRFLNSERYLINFCSEYECSLSIIRPTMIWGSGKDLNITFIQRFISNFGFFILPSRGNGLRWPIHHSDLLNLIFDLVFLDSDSIYLARGREQLSYYELVVRVFSWQGLHPVIFVLPSPLLPIAAFVARLIASKPYINISSFKRIDFTESQIIYEQNCLLSENSFHPLQEADVLRTSYLARLLNKILRSIFLLSLTTFRTKSN
jgi:hypothetical protein